MPDIGAQLSVLPENSPGTQFGPRCKQSLIFTRSVWHVAVFPGRTKVILIYVKSAPKVTCNGSRGR